MKVSPIYQEFLSDVLAFLCLSFLSFWLYRIVKIYKDKNKIKKWNDLPSYDPFFPTLRKSPALIAALAIIVGFISLIFLLKILINLGGSLLF